MERNSATGLVGLMSVALVLVIGLHQTGAVEGLAVDWANPIGWTLDSPPELVVGGFARQLGLILGYWVLASTAAYALARIGDLPMAGENLWTISAAHLNRSAGPAGNSDRVSEYWRKVIEANGATLRSGDPNLIYPGEVIALPPVGGS